MNNSVKSTLAVLSLAALVAAPASAKLTPQLTDVSAQSATINTELNSIDIEGAALLFGWTDSQIAANAEQLATLSFDDVDKLAKLFTARN